MQYLKRKFRKVQHPSYKPGIIPLGDFVTDGFNMYFRITSEEFEFISDKVTDEEYYLLWDFFMQEKINYPLRKKVLIILNKYLDMFEFRRKPLIPYRHRVKYRKIRVSIIRWFRHQLFMLGLPGGDLNTDTKWFRKKVEAAERKANLNKE